MEENMAMRGMNAAEVIQKNMALVQENKRLKAENDGLRQQLGNVRMLLGHEKYLADKYRQIRREQNKPDIRTWIRRVWDSMDEAWTVRVIIGTVIACSAMLAIAEIFPKILY